MNNEEMTKLLHAKGAGAVKDYIASMETPVESANAYNILVNHLYWQEKDLNQVVEIAQAGIAQGIRSAKESEKTKGAEVLKIVRALAYNLASFTWPGWDEPGIDITPKHLKAGLKAAEQNLKLAKDLGGEEIKLSRANWMVGAHQMAVKDFISAKVSFKNGMTHAQNAGEEAEALLSEVFMGLAGVLEKPDNQAAHRTLDDVKQKLTTIKGGKAFLMQLETAAHVFLET